MDDRWNGGGFIAPFALERLRRMLVTLATNREPAITSGLPPPPPLLPAYPPSGIVPPQP